MPKTRDSTLTLGWSVSSNLKPVFNPEGIRSASEIRPTDLVRIPPDRLARHSLVIASSGAGKSFFLGRILEELLLESSAKILVLDPNSDFRHFAQLREASSWSRPEMRMTERSRAECLERWPKEEITVKVGGNPSGGNSVKMTLPWLQVSPELIGDELDVSYRHDVFHCHLMFQDICELHEACGVNHQKAPEVFQDVLDGYRKGESKGAMEALTTHLDPSKAKDGDRYKFIATRVARRPKAIDESVEHYYASRLLRYRETQMVVYTQSWAKEAKRLRIIDLPSFEDPSLALMAINSELRRMWNIAFASTREAVRTPHVIVIDEAHHLIPATTSDRSIETIRHEIRRVVAEGRKFGLFLILASQRPEKLDSTVVSECENLALMRISSLEAAKRLRTHLQFDDTDFPFERAAAFPRGMAALYGRWADASPVVLLTAGRRTQEGGLSLPEDAWKPHARRRAGRLGAGRR